MPNDVLVMSSELQALKTELKTFFLEEVNKLMKEVQSANHTIEGVAKRVSTLTDKVQQLEINVPKGKAKVEDDDGLDDDDEDVLNGSDGQPDPIKTKVEQLKHRRLHTNTTGMGGKNCRNQGNDDPYAKVKFTIPSFYGCYDAEEYLD
ncbi:unnamed protein product [Urochloa humidicola]